MAFISKGGYRLRKIEEQMTGHSIMARQEIATTLGNLQDNTYSNLDAIASSIYTPIVFSAIATLDIDSNLLVVTLDDTGVYKTDSRMRLSSSPFKNTLIADDDILILGNFETVRCLIDNEAYDFSLESMEKGVEFLELRVNPNGLHDTFNGMVLHGLIYKAYPVKANRPVEPIPAELFATFPEYTKVSL